MFFPIFLLFFLLTIDTNSTILEHKQLAKQIVKFRIRFMKWFTDIYIHLSIALALFDVWSVYNIYKYLNMFWFDRKN